VSPGPLRDVCEGRTWNLFQIADLHVGILYIFAISSISVYGVVIAGWASRSKFPLMGGLRASAQMISYEVTLGLSLMGIIMVFGSVSLQEIVRAQGELSFGWLPRWGLLLQPFGALLFFGASLAETKRAPFDMPEAESELVAGYFTEYSSLKFAMFSLGEFVEVVLLACVFAALFLGGWQVPWLQADGFHFPNAGLGIAVGGAIALLGAAGLFLSVTRRSGLLAAVALPVAAMGAVLLLAIDWPTLSPMVEVPYWAVQLLRVAAMLTKVVFLCWLQLMVRWTLPRFRYDQVMRLSWRYMLPLSLINILGTGAVMLL
jgi:NADH-quinone oxidoreductase subunit H